MPPDPTIFVTAAEASGDAHAAGLIQALRRRIGGGRFVGIGGQRMAAAGCELLDNPVREAVMLLGSLRQFPYYRGVIRRAAAAMDELRPAVLVPVDSPMMNWHLARAARKRGIPVVYYIAPQVWAWATWRVGKLRRLADAVACILPFEVDYLRRRGVNAHYVGHPAFDHLGPPDPPDLPDAAGGQWRIALLPGSRESEIRNHAAAMAEVMDYLRGRFPQAQFTFTAVDDQAAEQIRRYSSREDLPIRVGRTDDVLRGSHFAVVASGTVTLEAAHFGVPMVVIHRVRTAGKWLYRLVFRWIIRIRRFSLINVLADEDLVPELIPWYGDTGRLIAVVESMLADTARLKLLRERLVDLVAPLRARPERAADNAARIVAEFIGDPRDPRATPEGPGGG